MSPMTLPQDEDALVRWAEGQVQKAKQWFPEAAARVEKRQREQRSVTTVKAAAVPETVEDLKRQFAQEAHEAFPNERDAVAVMHFSDTTRGQDLARRIELALEHMHQRGMKGVTKMTRDEAWQEIEKRAGELVSKSTTPMSKAKAIDQVCRQDKGLWAAYRNG